VAQGEHRGLDRTTTRRPNVTLLFEHVFEDRWAVGRVVPAHPVLPGGHPGAAGGHQPRPGSGPRQSIPAHHEPAPRERGGFAPHRLLPRPAACLGQAHDRHVDGGMHVHRAQRQPPGSTGAAAMVACQRHHPTTALIEVDAGARLPSALRPLWEQVCRGARGVPACAGVGSSTCTAARLHQRGKARPGRSGEGAGWRPPGRGRGSGTRGGRRALSLYIAARHTCPAHRQPRLARLE